MTTAPRSRPPRPQTVLEVLEQRWLSPHLVRIRAGGPGFAAFKNNPFTDKYVKILFAKPELGLTPPYDFVSLRSELPAEDLPVNRTYTVREVNEEEGWISIDFVVHGEEGIAGRWAAQAQPGETLVFFGPGGAWAPNPEADWYLLAGDESALPAIAAALEVLPSGAIGDVLLEVHGPEDELALQAPAGVRIHWLHRGQAVPGTTELLPRAIAALPWRGGRVEVFAHGERGCMKALRDLFLKEKGLERGQLSVSAYWAHGRNEDSFQAEKKEPIGQVLP